MKKLSFLLFALIGLIGLNSCTEDDSFTFVAKPDPAGLAFTSATADNYELKASNGASLAERFVWNPVDFDVQTPVNYQLAGSADMTFDYADPIFGGEVTNAGVTVSEMLSLAADAGLDNDPETDAPNTGTINFQVRAFVGGDGGNVVEQFSDVITVNVTLPEAEEEETEAPLKNLFMVGDATAAGWNPDNNNTPLFRDSNNENIFNFTGRFAGGADVEGFKLVEVLGQWQPQWGGTDGVLAVNPGDGSDPAAFSVDSDSYYTLSLNLEDMTYTWESYDASEATEYDKIGLVGEGTTVGWPNDENPTPDVLLTKSTFDPHIWYAMDVELSEAGIKFRANQTWDVNWGGGQNFPSGQSTGDDIIVSKAGTYTVWFNDLTGRYIFIPQGEE